MPEIEMPAEYVGRPIDMPEDRVQSDPITQEVQALLERLGMAAGYVTPEPAIAAGELRPATDMTVPFSQEYQSVKLDEHPQNRPDYAISQDLFGAERGAPEPGPGPSPTALPTNPYTTSRSLGGAVSDVQAGKPPRTLEEAESGFNQAFQGYVDAYQTSADARFAAEKARGERIVAAEDRAVARMEESNKEFRTRRELAQAGADQETAAWLQKMDDLAKKEPDPGRYWENLPDFNKALWMLGIAFGSWATAGNPNAKVFGIELLQQAINQDIQSQRDRLSQQMESLRTRGQLMSAKHARLLSDLADDRSAEFQRIQALEKAWVARATLPGDLDAQAAKMEGLQFLTERKMVLAGEYRKEAEARRAAAATRSFQRELAVIEASMKAQATPGFDKEGKPLYPTAVSGIDPRTGKPLNGVAAIRADGKPATSMQPGVPQGAVVFRDDKTRGEFGTVVHQANERYRLLVKLEKRLGALDESKLAKMGQFALGSLDPELKGDLRELAYLKAKSWDPRISNQDFSNALSTLTGFDADGNWAERGKFVTNLGKIRRMISEERGRMPKTVSDNLSNSFVDSSINPEAASIVWDPTNMNADQVEPKSATQRFGVEGASGAQLESGERAAPSAAGGIKPSAKEYRRRAEIEASDSSRRLTQLPAHDAGKVEEVLQGAEGLSPAHIRANAARVLDSFAKDESPKAKNTATIVKSVTEDLARAAESKVKRLEDKVRTAAQWRSPPSEDAVRNWVKNAGFTDAEDVAAHVLEVYRAASSKVKSTKDYRNPMSPSRLLDAR